MAFQLRYKTQQEENYSYLSYFFIREETKKQPEK